jgi:hypothetical protein
MDQVEKKKGRKMEQWVRTKVILTSKADPQIEGIFKNLKKMMLSEA